MTDDGLDAAQELAHKAYQVAFDFKVKEAAFFVRRILDLKREIEKPFLHQHYSDSLHKRVIAAAEPRCEEAAFYYDALLSATFSALDCLARAHSFIERGTRRKNGRFFTIKDVSFNVWMNRLRVQLSESSALRGEVPETCNLERIVELDEKRFSRLRQMRNFYTHERHPVQDCDVDSISMVDGQVSGISLPLAWEQSDAIDFIDVSAEQIHRDLQTLTQCTGPARDWFVVFSGNV